MRAAAQVLSYIFHPIFLPTAGLLVIFSLNTYIAHTTPINKQLFILVWIFINTAIIPLLFTMFLRWKNVVTSIQLHHRKDRVIPFTFATFFYITNYWLMRDVPLPDVMYSLFLGSTVAVALALFFTLFTKISIHMIGMGGLVASMYGVAQLFDLPIVGLVMLGIVASGLVGSARYILESHTPKQIYLGWVTGFLCVYVVLINGWG